MKKVCNILIIFSLFTLTTVAVNAQCKNFAKKICLPELGDYIHDGNFNAAVLTEGEEAELYKTFYSNTNYRIAICGSDVLPNVEFRVIDADKNVLYTNKDKGFARTWDFKLEASQQLKIVVKVHPTGKSSEEVASGCVAIMFGLKEK